MAFRRKCTWHAPGVPQPRGMTREPVHEVSAAFAFNFATRTLVRQKLHVRRGNLDRAADAAKRQCERCATSPCRLLAARKIRTSSPCCARRPRSGNLQINLRRAFGVRLQCRKPEHSRHAQRLRNLRLACNRKVVAAAVDPSPSRRSHCASNRDRKGPNSTCGPSGNRRPARSCESSSLASWRSLTNRRRSTEREPSPVRSPLCSQPKPDESRRISPCPSNLQASTRAAAFCSIRRLPAHRSVGNQIVGQIFFYPLREHRRGAGRNVFGGEHEGDSCDFPASPHCPSR